VEGASAVDGAAAAAAGGRCSSVAGPPSCGRPIKLTHINADPTTVSVLRDHIGVTFRRTRHQYVCPRIGAKTRGLQARAENDWSFMEGLWAD
jgi:hypothetical protein